MLAKPRVCMSLENGFIMPISGDCPRLVVFVLCVG